MLTKKLFIGMSLVICTSVVHGQQTETMKKNNVPDAPSWVADAVFY